MEEFKKDLKQLIITSCGLSDLTHDSIVDDAPLFQEGLGLDSIDALELAVAIERKYQVTIPDEVVAKQVFRSINTLAEFVQREAARPG
jgi:acyl carrier protein